MKAGAAPLPVSERDARTGSRTLHRVRVAAVVSAGLSALITGLWLVWVQGLLAVYYSQHRSAEAAQVWRLWFSASLAVSAALAIAGLVLALWQARVDGRAGRDGRVARAVLAAALLALALELAGGFVLWVGMEFGMSG